MIILRVWYSFSLFRFVCAPWCQAELWAHSADSQAALCSEMDLLLVLQKQQNWKANWQTAIDRFKQRITIKVKQEVLETHTLRCRLTKPREQREDREGEGARTERHTQRRDKETNGPINNQGNLNQKY